MRHIDRIIVHCADTPAGMDIGAKEIRHWHTKERGWKDIGYHFVIRRDGTLEYGRDVDVPGAHAKGHNASSIGICLVGGKPDFNFTRLQMRELEDLVDTLKEQFPGVKIIGHRDVSSKSCPCFDVKEYFSN